MSDTSQTLYEVTLKMETLEKVLIIISSCKASREAVSTQARGSLQVSELVPP